jgi:uncharacterized membrane protein
MRQVMVEIPRDRAARAVDIARRHGAVNLSRVDGSDADGRHVALVLAHVSNHALEPLVSALQELDDLRVSLLPVGALALHPPASAVADQVVDVTPRSPLEVYVAGLQSIGSWGGFLGYAVTGAVVVWLAVTTDAAYLLVGAMLIAPFAGPAVNTAIATARGDLHLLWRSLLRYVVALLVTAGTAAALTLLFHQRAATELMTSITSVPRSAVLLPMAAGAAGALHLAQSEQSSLVSGAAAGMLIAASLAPPAGVVGMVLVMGEHELLLPALFLLALQLGGINLAAALVLRAFGLSPRGARYDRGRDVVRVGSYVVTLAALAALGWWQFGSGPTELERSSLAQRMREAVLAELSHDDRIRVVRARSSFPRAADPRGHTLLVELVVQRRDSADDVERIRREVVARVRRTAAAEEPSVAAVASVTVAER